jgi:cysteine desulfurase
VRQALVLFSGGVDSTYITTKTADQFDKLILMTYRVPGMAGVERSRKMAEQLQRLFPGKLEHRLIDIRDFVNERRGGVVECIRDNVRYKFFYSWCMGCKVSMHLFTMDYCKEQGIEVVMDGSNFYDAHALEQHKSVKDLLSEVYRSRGVEFVTPHYFEARVTTEQRADLEFLRALTLHKDSTEYRAAHLRKLNVDLGFSIGSQYRSNQPSCVTSVFFNAARVPLRAVFGEEEGCCFMSHGYLNYIADKIYGREISKDGSALACPVQPGEDVYFDSASTSQMDRTVADVVHHVQTEMTGNASALHSLGVKAAEQVEAARKVIAKRLGAKSEEVIFTSGGTEANNLAITGAALQRQPGKDQIITTPIEHPSVAETSAAMAAFGYEVITLPVDREGQVNPADLEAAITERTRLVSIIHGNHEIGVVQPLAKLGAICRKHGVLFHSDACQSFTKVEIDVEKSHVDLLSINGHKIHGPTGIGALYIKRGTELAPHMKGGGQEGGIRSGTLNTASIVGFAKAVELATKEHVAAIGALRDSLIEKLRSNVGGITLNGPTGDRLCNHLSLTVEGVAGKTMLARMNAAGFYLSTRSACSSRVLTPSPVLLAIGLTEKQALSTARISLSRFNTDEEIERFADAFEKIVAAERASSRTAA